MSNNIYLKKGLNIPIKGCAKPVVSKKVVPDTVAIVPEDFKGLSPRLLVREGDAVLAGSPVLADKKNPDILAMECQDLLYGIYSQKLFFYKVIPFLIGILSGYLLAIVLGEVEFAKIADAKFFEIPKFLIPIKDYTFSLTIIP